MGKKTYDYLGSPVLDKADSVMVKSIGIVDKAIIPIV